MGKHKNVSDFKNFINALEVSPKTNPDRYLPCKRGKNPDWVKNPK